jgi:PAS domain S-box-containing protein
MSDRGPARPAGHADYRRHVEQLVQRLSEAEHALQALGSGELDAVLDPATASPILLSRAQEAVARSEARYRDLVDRAPSIVCELKPDGTLIFVNQAVRTLLGHDPATLVGRDWMERLIAAPDSSARMIRSMHAGDVTGFELPLRAASGQIRWIAFNSANRYSPDGRLEGVVLFGIDVTDRREAEDRARELAAAQVARAEAEAANQAKTQFLAVMSHELRTPLNAVIGYVQLLEMGLRGPVTPAQTDDLGRIRRSTVHLLGLINDLLNFARLEAGEVSFVYGQFRVLELLEKLRTLTATQAAEKGHRLLIGPCPPDLKVWGDREKVDQILINLVSNAIKFTPDGGVIRVDCAQDGDFVRMAVDDTGPGISTAKIERIFEPFVQVDKELTRTHEGVGLGLAISRDLARAMNGEILVASKPGAGSTFTLRLPRRKPA